MQYLALSSKHGTLDFHGTLGTSGFTLYTYIYKYIYIIYIVSRSYEGNMVEERSGVVSRASGSLLINLGFEPHQTLRCFVWQKLYPYLRCTGWFQERIRA